MSERWKNVRRKPFSRRRLFQFRLRSLLAVMLACCLATHFAPAVWGWVFPPGLPDPYYGASEEIQYFSPGPQFKLSKQAAAAQAYKADLARQSISQTAPSH